MTTYRKTAALDPGRNILSVRHGDTVSPNACTIPAGWLPLNTEANSTAMGFLSYEYTVNNNTDYLVMMPGKVLAYTREGNVNSVSLTDNLNKGEVGRLVPAGIRKAWKAAAGSDVVLTYTALDVTQRVEDLGTGNFVSVAKTYTKDQLTAALISRGLLQNAESLDAFISLPVGIAAHPVYRWGGGDGTQVNNLAFENYRRQSQLAFWTGQDNTIKLPVLPLTAQTEIIPAVSTVYSASSQLTGAAAKWATGNGDQLTSVVHNSVTGASLKAKRYAALTNTNYVALVVGTQGIEHDALYHPITITRSGTDVTSAIMKRETSSPQSLRVAGDYFVDRDMGIVFFYENGGNALPTGMSANDVINFSANSTTTGRGRRNATVFAGPVMPGCRVTYNVNSDFVMATLRPDETEVVATDGTDATDANDAATVSAAAYVDPADYTRPEEIIGHCYSLDRGPHTDLTLTHTHHTYDGVPLQDRAPGSATNGFEALTADAIGGRFCAIVRVTL